MSSSGSSSDRCHSDFMCLEIRARDATLAELAAAEAFEAGAEGLEEREDADGTTLLLYVRTERAAQVGEVLQKLGVDGIEFRGAKPVVHEDWSESWKQGLEPINIGRRLRIRPSFAPAGVDPSRQELEIDPGQAFGTGGHASTRLALEWIDSVAATLGPETRILDVGCGTGVLALAALRLSDATAVAFDLDPLAAIAALDNAARNGLADRIEVFTGGIDAVRGNPFELVVANLLKRELLSLVDEIARCTRKGGLAVFSGLLLEDCDSVVQKLEAAGFVRRGLRSHHDGGDVWVSLLMSR